MHFSGHGVSLWSGDIAFCNYHSIWLFYPCVEIIGLRVMQVVQGLKRACIVLSASDIIVEIIFEDSGVYVKYTCAWNYVPRKLSTLNDT